MRAVVYDRHGGPDVLRIEDVPEPVCHRKGVLIRVEAISIEGGDLLDRSGNFAPLGAGPRVLGRQAAGEIVEVGAEVEGFEIGQRAVAVRPQGSHAALFAAPIRTTWAIPGGLSTIQAAAVPIAFGTAHEALFHYARMEPGEVVLVQAGAGGVGIAAIQIARRNGAGLILATGSSDERLARLKALGLDHAINYRDTDVAAEVMRLTGGKGADIVIDTVGGDTLQGSLMAMARGGRLVASGQASRARVVLDLANLYAMGVTLLGLKLDIASQRVHEAVAQLLEACGQGHYQVAVDRTFAMEEVAAAHAYIESRKAFGRVVLIP